MHDEPYKRLLAGDEIVKAVLYVVVCGVPSSALPHPFCA